MRGPPHAVSGGHLDELIFRQEFMGTFPERDDAFEKAYARQKDFEKCSTAFNSAESGVEK